jgi:hypothetical protein
MSLKIDRKGAGLGFCFTRNGENWLLRRQTVACTGENTQILAILGECAI